MKKHFTTEQKGELFLFVQGFLWGFFPIISILTINHIPPLYSAAFSTIIAAIFFSIYLTYKKQWKYLFVSSVWVDIFIATLLIAVGFYALVFIGLKYTTAGNASIKIGRAHV